MNYQKLRNRPAQFQSVTSLTVEEFDYLLSSFSDKWRNYYKVYTIEGKRRKSPLSNPLKNTKTLPTVSDKLFFILVYLKNYSLQQKTGADFDFSQSQTSKWVKTLRPLLAASLNTLKLMPVREGYKVAGVLEKLDETKCFQDASERLINRPKDQEAQKEVFSGKKKAHTVKNNFISTESQYVAYLSPTHEGKMHDKKIADEAEIVFPDDIQLFQDTGYQGYRPENVYIVQPFKKPKNGELSDLHKWFNKYVASVRITNEHAINGLKRLRIVKDKCRHSCLQFRDQIIEICVGLHNLRVTSPFRRYKSKVKWEVNSV